MNPYHNAMEHCVPPEGLRERMEQRVLAAQPHKTEAFKPRGFRKRTAAVLLAAALACAMGTSAVALSPALREYMFGAAGPFAPYVRPAESAVVTADGYELRVDSVVADHYLIVAYLEIRDLEGSRLTKDMDVFGIFRQTTPENAGVTGAILGGQIVHCDADGKTALAAVMEWGGQSVGDPNMTLQIIDPLDCEIPITLEYTPIQTVDLSGLDTAGVLPKLDRLELSPVGVNLVCAYQADAAAENTQDRESLRGPLTVHYADGSQRASVRDGLRGSFQLTVASWLFMDPYNLVQPEDIEPLDTENIVGISCQDWYIPIENGTAGPIQWS